MKSNMREIMEKSWREWHNDIDEDYIPTVNLCYEKGFKSCYDALIPILKEAATHVLASHVAEHMLDGFRQQRRPIDKLVDRIKEVMPNDS